MMAWYEDYDFAEDPFTSSSNLFGLDKVLDEIVYRVESGSMVFVEGKEGSGKSAVLKKLIERFGGRGKVIYFDCGQIERKVNIEGLMTGKYGFFGRLFKKVPKNMILLLDNANRLSRKNCERIKHYFDSNYVKSVVFTGGSYSRAHFSRSLRDRIGGRVIRLRDLTPEQSVEAVRAKAPSVNLLPDDIIKEAFRLSAHNTKKFLASVSALCDKAVSDGADKVSEKHVKEVFGEDGAR